MTNFNAEDYKDRALLMSDVYNDHVDNENLPKNWKPLRDYSDPLSGYFGRAYYNDQSREVIIVHRGTEPPSVASLYSPNARVEIYKDLFSDGQLALGQTPFQLKQAEKFTEIINKEIRNNPEFKGFTTEHDGHSLGGWLAQVIATKEGKVSFTIEAPGSESYLKALVSNGDISQEKYDFANSHQVVVVGPSNLVNNSIIDALGVDTHRHVGNKYILDDLEPSNSVVGFMLDQTGNLHYHGMDRYVEAFTNNFNENPENKLTDISNIFRVSDPNNTDSNNKDFEKGLPLETLNKKELTEHQKQLIDDLLNGKNSTSLDDDPLKKMLERNRSDASSAPKDPTQDGSQNLQGISPKDFTQGSNASGHSYGSQKTSNNLAFGYDEIFRSIQEGINKLNNNLSKA
jgi:hypothetical protein